MIASMDQQVFQTTVLDLIRGLQEDNRAIRNDQQVFQATILDLIRGLQEDNRAIREEMNTGFHNLREELKAEIRDVKDDLRDVKGDLRRLRSEVHEDRKKLDEVYQARNTMKIKFGWGWSVMSLLIAITASAITQVFGN